MLLTHVSSHVLHVFCLLNSHCEARQRYFLQCGVHIKAIRSRWMLVSRYPRECLMLTLWNKSAYRFSRGSCESIFPPCTSVPNTFSGYENSFPPLWWRIFFFSFLHSVGKYIRQYYAIATACCNSKCNVLFFFQDDSYQSTRWGRSHMVAWALLCANLFKPKQVISSKMSRRVWRGQSASLKGTVCNISSVFIAI